MLAALLLVLGNLFRIGSRGVAAEGVSLRARRLPAVASAQLEWGPAQIGKAMLAAVAALAAAEGLPGHGRAVAARLGEGT